MRLEKFITGINSGEIVTGPAAVFLLAPQREFGNLGLNFLTQPSYRGTIMPATAREVMDTSFSTLTPGQTISEAVTVMKEASKTSGHTIFGLMVLNDQGQLVGMLSLYDIFLLIRPKHIHIWGEMSDLEVSGIMEAACQRAKKILVGDIMTTDLITITPDTHVLHVIDIMIKKHVRRLPVLEDGRVIGMVYISRVFDYLLKNLA